RHPDAAALRACARRGATASRGHARPFERPCLLPRDAEGGRRARAALPREASGGRVTRLAGRNAIVTGAASGIGRAIAERFAAEGAAVLIADVQRDAGETVATAIRTGGGQAEFVATDVTAEADVRAMVDAAVARFGGLDILVNNAGIGRF